jgi:hypothetical protein
MDSNNILGRYGYKAGAGAAAVILPNGVSLSTCSAFATAAGATMQINGGDLVPVPVNGSVSADVAAGIVSQVGFPVTIAFVGTSGYFVDWYGG